MAALLSKKLFFPCASPNNVRSLMAANTHRGSGPMVRIVAFEQSEHAHAALSYSRQRELELVVGPALKYKISAIDAEVDTLVWNATAMDVINCGILSFHLDVCRMSADGVVDVQTSYNIDMEQPDPDISRMNLLISWQM